MGFLASIFTTILGGLGDYVRGRQEMAKVRLESEVAIHRAEAEARIASLQATQNAEIAWDAKMADASSLSWKDEFWTILLAAPLIMCFVPGLADYAKQGFNELNTIPEWYRYAVGTAIAAAFGVRQLINIIGKARK